MRPTHRLAAASASVALALALGAGRAGASGPTALTPLSDGAVLVVGAGAELEVTPEGRAVGVRSGRADVVAGAATRLTAGEHDLVVAHGLVALAVEGDGVTFCLHEGEAIVDGVAQLEAPGCRRFAPDGVASGTPEPLALLPLPPLATHPVVELDPRGAVTEALAPWLAGESAAAGPGEVEGGGAAACLDSGAEGGGEASGPGEGGLPEHELERAMHRLEVRVLLEEP
jgi:hypothetical protein